MLVTTFIVALLVVCLVLWVLFSTQLVSPKKTTSAMREDLVSQPGQDFAWFIERPKEAPMVGWEDKWMAAWKKKRLNTFFPMSAIWCRYDPSSRGRCYRADEITPFKDGYLCDMPAYIPARVISKSPQKITRVIFQVAFELFLFLRLIKRVEQRE